MSRIEVITLDLDDTLWDGRTALVYAEQAVYSWLAVNYPRITSKYSIEQVVARRHELVEKCADIRHDFTALRTAALEDLAHEAGYDTELAVDGIAVFLKARNHVDIFSEVVPALESLGRNYRLVSITNGNADIHKTILGEYFELAVTPEMTGTAKPDPRMFDVVLDRTEVDAEAVLHVGDEPYTDVLGAQRAGVCAVWINRYGREWPTAVEPPHAEIFGLDELNAVVEAL